MKFCVLSSGSKGNAIWVEGSDGAILVDCGLSGRELRRRLTLAGLDAGRLRAVLVSHEHSDHILGVGVVARLLKIPVYINQATLGGCSSRLGKFEPRLYRTGFEFQFGSLIIHPFSVSHDAADAAGFTFCDQGVKLGLATDLGASTALVRERLAGCRAVILESNHDPDLLQNGPYPWDLKKRVRGRRGHLANQEAAELLAAIDHGLLQTVVLAHLSETNNRPEIAFQTVKSVFSARPRSGELVVARQDEPIGVFEINSG